jgi:DNA (cytosine-5)-methyltransferase 1
VRILDLFSGIGGFALGMEMAGFPPPVAFCEIEPFCRQVLAKHWPEVPYHEDVTKLSADAVRPIDLVCGGFPCQDISCAGKGLGVEHGERSGLWREMFRLIGELMPRWVLVENVPALRTRGADRVIADLETLGYTVWPIVVGAWAVGAPHKRDRAWIVAHCNGVREHEQKGCIGHQRRRAEDSSFSALAHAKPCGVRE